MENCYKKNGTYQGASGKTSTYDIAIPVKETKSLVVFIHGYMGFKDWGAWNLMADYFAENDFAFLKMNLSHNGTALEDLENFSDLVSFSKNTYSKEIEDVNSILKHIEKTYTSFDSIHLIGHSRGGGISLLAHDLNPKIKTISTLAAISSIEKRFSDEHMLRLWKKEGIRYVKNQRTQQEMPHSYEQVEDFIANKEKLSIEKAIKKCTLPLLIIHGSDDSSVSIEEGEELATWSKNHLNIIQDTDHVFGAKHPWNETFLPKKLMEACNLVLTFIRQHE